MKRHIFPILVIMAMSITLYTNTLFNGFVYDDEYTIVNNPLIKDVGNFPVLLQKYYFAISGEESYRPVVTFTYFIDYALFGLNAWGYHLTNIILHTINGALLYILLSLIIKHPFSNNRFALVNPLENLSLAISLLFVSHPVLTEAINAISFREDLLAYLFYIATIILYLYIRSIHNRLLLSSLLYGISCLVYTLALLSKEMAATLPLLIIFYEWLSPPRKERSGVLNLQNIGYIVITFVYIYAIFYFRSYIRQIAGHETATSFSLIERIFTSPWLLLNYARLTIIPVHLSAEYIIEPIYPYLSILALLVIVIIITIPCVANLANWFIPLGILFFFITLAPVYNIIPIRNPFAERYLYIPTTGFVISLGAFIYQGAKHNKFKYFFLVAFIAIIVLNSANVVLRNLIWNNNITLWSDVVKKIPNSSRAHDNLGFALYNQGNLYKAIEHYKDAVRLKPNSAKAHNNLGRAYAGKDQFDLALKEFETAREIEPNNPIFHSNIGLVHEKQGRINEAIESYRIALNLNPVNSERHFNIGRLYAIQGKYEEAINEYEIALKQRPDDLFTKVYLEKAYNELKEHSIRKQ